MNRRQVRDVNAWYTALEAIDTADRMDLDDPELREWKRMMDAKDRMMLEGVAVVLEPERVEGE